VAGATSGKVELVVQRKQGAKWTTVRRVKAAVARDGSFARVITAASGRHRVQARFAGTAKAKASKSPYRAFARTT